jgi:cold shock CspA family protein
VVARFRGHLQAWNEQGGFGFIRPVEGGDEIFVHGSALPAPRPGSDEVLTFEVGVNAEGKKKAVNVRRQADEAAALRADRERSALRRPSTEDRAPRRGEARGAPMRFVLGLALLGGLAWFGYGAYRDRLPRPEQALQEPASHSATARSIQTSSYRCDGRTMCSQMRSCEEATFFLRNCPGTEMDGDGDGVPCEQQWCTGSFR